MILDIKNDYQVLYLDNDEEKFSFHTRHLSIEEYLEHWRGALRQLNETSMPIVLPTYIEYGDVLDVQGYIVYLYESAWILIDSGVKMPRTTDLSSMHKYIDKLDEQLPENQEEWQSHWWLTGNDLSELASCIGLHLIFEENTIPTTSLKVKSTDEKVSIYADRQRFDIVLSSFKNSEEVRVYSKRQIEDFVSKKSAIAIIPADVDSEQMWLYCFFNSNERDGNIAQFSLPCHNAIADFTSIKRYLEAKDGRPYVVKENPQVYTLHARYSAGTISKLLDIF